MFASRLSVSDIVGDIRYQHTRREQIVDSEPNVASLSHRLVRSLNGSDHLMLTLGALALNQILAKTANLGCIRRRTVSSILPVAHRSSMLDELDFTKEAANQETFRTFLEDSGIDHEVTAPKVFPDASTKRVLTMVRYCLRWVGTVSYTHLTLPTILLV